MKKILALLTTSVLALGLLVPTMVSTEETVTVQAASGTGYTKAEDVDYVKSGNYIANWGARDEDCGFLSSYAENFYTGNYTFDKMSLKSGGATISAVPNSTLYKDLQTLMKSKHSNETSYNATRDKFCYTDCVKSNYSKISSFYSGQTLSGTWDGGSTWNREHVWPNSKGDLAGNGENDIMMLRPASVSENSSRGNKAYGEGSAYYDPNGEGQEVRGDCARVVLYQYVRWGCINTGSKYNSTDIFGSDGVIQSLSILLEWMEEDPVDTWEMGRNDAVQSITGTRNVFVDYPEYAWLLFGKDVPDDMVTPSGNAGGVVTPPPSGGGDSGSEVEPDDGGDDVVGDPWINQIVKSPVAGKAYYLYMYQGNADKVVYLAGGMNGYYLETTTDKDDALPVYLETTNGGYYFYCYVNGVKTYINTVAGSQGHVNGAYETKASTVYTFNTQYNTLVNGAGYFFGTRGDKTYTTIGPCADEYLAENFIVHFIESGLPNDSNAPSVPDTPTVPDTPVNPDTPNEPSTPNNSGSVEDGSSECEHEYGKWHEIVKPTTEKDGEKVRFCEHCGHEEKETIPMLEVEDSSESTEDVVETPETSGCGSTIGAVSVGSISLLAVGFYLRKKRED